MVRIDVMADRIHRLGRRELLSGLGAAVLTPATAGIAIAQARPSLKLKARAGAVALRPGPDTPMVAARPCAGPGLRFGRGGRPNRASKRTADPDGAQRHGIDGVASANRWRRGLLSPRAAQDPW
jgi:hypothetical protein